jgi:hypothetical protein
VTHVTPGKVRAVINRRETVGILDKVVVAVPMRSEGRDGRVNARPGIA